MIEIRHSSSPEEIRALAARGFEPIECSVGGESIVGPLVMDHHGARAHLEGVALRAYRDHFGARAADPRFVVTGQPDADATFAIAALAGRLPPRREVDLHALVHHIDLLDRDPIGLDLSRDVWGRTLLVFQALVTGPADAELFHFGVAFWRQAAHGLPSAVLAAMGQVEHDRRETARAARVLRDGRVLVVASPVWGYDVWYGRGEGDPADPATWAHPVVVCHDGRKVSIGCPNEAVARRLLGDKGLLEVAASLEPPGWGGRPSIMGSPRGVVLGEAVALAAGDRVARALRT